MFFNSDSHCSSTPLPCRSWFADAFVFEQLLHRDGMISDLEHTGAPFPSTDVHCPSPAICMPFQKRMTAGARDGTTT
jgi:hypothetical protein